MYWFGLLIICFGLIALRQSVAIVLLCGAVYAQVVWGEGSPVYLIEDVWYAIDNSLLLSIPMFLLAGALMSHGSIARRLINIIRIATQWLPGGLAVATIISCAFFAAISGSSTVTMLTMGAILYPALLSEGYPKSFSLGAITSAGTLGIIIPPSIPLIIYGIVNELSIVDLFLAGVVPGLLLTFVLALYSLGSNRKMPSIPFEMGAFLSALKDGVWAIFLPVIMLGGIYTGFFTPTEAAAVAVAYALVVEIFIHKDIGLKDVWKICAETSRLLGTLIPIIAVVVSLQHLLTVLGVQEGITDWVLSTVDNKIMFLLAVNVLLLLAGCFIDPLSAILILSPLLLPPAMAFGVDPIHLAIIMVVNLEIGLLTPPVGLNLIVATTAYQEKFGLIVKSVIPFMLLMMVTLIVITFVPSISLVFIK